MENHEFYLNLAKEYSTPLYVYDAVKIENQYTNFTKAFARLPVKVKYACKALTNPHVLSVLRRMGSGVDAVSIQEVQLSKYAGFNSENIMYSPNGVHFSEIEEAVEEQVQVNVDNLDSLVKFGIKFRGKVPLCIRLNPHIMAGGNIKISTGHIDSKFGISIFQIEDIVSIVKKYGIVVNGLHVHTGSDIVDADVFVKGAEILFQVAEEHFPELSFIDFGSGFKVSYKSDDLSTDLTSVAEKLEISYDSFTRKYGSKPELWFEPGKYMVSEAGTLLVCVNVVKATPVSTFIGVDSGLNHLLRPMMYDAYHDIKNISNPNGQLKAYNVVGYICETDTFAYDRPIQEVAEGDILAIKNAGAYGFSMSSQYNSRLRPAEVLIRNGQHKLIRRRETFEDLLGCVPAGEIGI